MSHVSDVKYKGAKIVLDGKEYTLRFDLNAFAELEEIYGSVEEALKKMEEGSLKAIRSLIWVGLLHQNEHLTQKQVGSMITFNNLEELGKALAEAMEGAMPKIEQGKPIM